MGLLAAGLTGLVLGLRHSVEADHLAAIASLVDEDSDNPVLIGSLWGVGHSIPIFVLGGAIIYLDLDLPHLVGHALEMIVGVILVLLGARTIYKSNLLPDFSVVQRHRHGNGIHSHLDIGGLRLGWMHIHYEEESFLVGVLHGLLGTGALVSVLVGTTDSVQEGAVFLFSFASASVLFMALIGFMWRGLLGRERINLHLKVSAGALCVLIGVVFILAGAGVAGFIGHH